MFRLKTEAGSEVLFQADNEAGLTQWVQVVESAINAKDPRSSGSGVGQHGSSSSSSNRKLTSSTATRNRSPTGQSPVSKNRKASAGKLLIFFFLFKSSNRFRVELNSNQFWIRVEIAIEFCMSCQQLIQIFSLEKKIHHPKGHDVVSMTHFPYYLG